MENLRNQTTFITGGARGIGLGMARAFAREGAKLALADIDAQSLAAAKAELSKQTAVETFVLDVRDRAAYARVVDETESRLGQITVLCNNAGVAGYAPAAKMSFENWDWVLGINIGGVINGVQIVVSRMIARRGPGHVVNTASGAGLAPTESGMQYATSKYAVVGLSEVMRGELATYGIGVTVLCPGPVATQILSNSQETDPGRARQTPEEAKNEQAVRDMITGLLAQGVQPDRVGDMVVAAVKANRLYLHTDRIMEEPIKTRAKDLLEALP